MRNLYEIRYSDDTGLYNITNTSCMSVLFDLSKILTSEDKKLLSVVNHGRAVGYRQDPYHDVTIYEDGYEDRFYIGE